MDAVQQIMNDKNNFDKEMSRVLAQLGDEALKFFKASFEKQGFTDKNFEAWEKDEDSKGGQILVKTGALRDSLKVVKIDNDTVSIQSDLPYAQVQNEGGNTGRSNNTRIPARKFLGDSNELTEALAKVIDSKVKNIFK
jgi:phage gpG-like protein